MSITRPSPCCSRRSASTPSARRRSLPAWRSGRMSLRRAKRANAQAAATAVIDALRSGDVRLHGCGRRIGRHARHRAHGSDGRRVRRRARCPARGFRPTRHQLGGAGTNGGPGVAGRTGRCARPGGFVAGGSAARAGGDELRGVAQRSPPDRGRRKRRNGTLDSAARNQCPGAGDDWQRRDQHPDLELACSYTPAADDHLHHQRRRVPRQGQPRQRGGAPDQQQLRAGRWRQVYGFTFTCEEIDYLDSKAESETRRAVHA